MTIEAKIICDSISKDKNRLTTFELRYPRFIHDELMTHRVFSRNTSSSRAIPIEKFIQMCLDDPAIPVRWGLNGKGMQDHGEMSPAGAEAALKEWLKARDSAVKHAKKMLILAEQPHKQCVNRMLLPWAHAVVVVTSNGPGLANWFGLRLHESADPTIRALAREMYNLYKVSTPKTIAAGDWHLPYIQEFEWSAVSSLPGEEQPDKMLDLVKISVARCARTSYRTTNGKLSTLDEDLNLYTRLVGTAPLHASPAEHQATPDTCKIFIREGKIVRIWDQPELSGNFGPGWIQFRKTLLNENITTYTED